MKLVHGIGLVGCLAFMSAGVILGCSGDDSSPGTPADAGKDSTTGTDSGTDTGTGQDTGTGEDTGTGSDTGTGTDSGGDAGATPDCTTYCTKIAAACTGDKAQYIDMTSCMNACKYMPVGTANDSSGNTLGCRITHAGLAVANPSPHCWHAGPYGFGGCGSEADGFCQLAVGYCSPSGGFDAAAPPYASVGECTTAVAAFAHVDAGSNPSTYNSTGPTSGNTFDCREYHLSAALPGTAQQTVHCKHPGVVSPVCF